VVPLPIANLPSPETQIPSDQYKNKKKGKQFQR
jgi:hypothetical protein